MSNKRIQKKREKRAWQRDKSRVIASLVVLMEPGLSQREHLRMAKPLWELDMRSLIDLYWRESLRRSPLRRIIPRQTWTGEPYNWRPVISQYGGL